MDHMDLQLMPRSGSGGGVGSRFVSSKKGSGRVGNADAAADAGVGVKVADVLPNSCKGEDRAGLVDEETASGFSRVLPGALAQEGGNDFPVLEDCLSVTREDVDALTDPPRFVETCHDPDLVWACTVWGVLSRVKPGDKLAFLGDWGRSKIDIDIDRASVWTPFRRAVRGDGREALLTFVPDFVLETQKLVRRLAATRSLPQHFPILVLNGVRGLESLRHTYAHDARFLARYDACLASIRHLDALLNVQTSTYLPL